MFGIELFIEECFVTWKANKIKKIRVVLPQKINNRNHLAFFLVFKWEHFLTRSKKFKVDSFEANIRNMPSVPLNAPEKKSVLIFNCSAILLKALSDASVIDIREDVEMTFVRSFYRFNKCFKSIVFGNICVFSLLRPVHHIGIVISQLLYWWLQNYHILQFTAIVNNIGLIDQGMSVNEVKILFCLEVMRKSGNLFVLLAKLKATGDVIS